MCLTNAGPPLAWGEELAQVRNQQGQFRNLGLHPFLDAHQEAAEAFKPP